MRSMTVPPVQNLLWPYASGTKQPVLIYSVWSYAANESPLHLALECGSELVAAFLWSYALAAKLPVLTSGMLLQIALRIAKRLYAAGIFGVFGGNAAIYGGSLSVSEGNTDIDGHHACT
eukprot:672736-Rhodomonas_salina.1